VEALTQWVGTFPEELVAEMGEVAPMLSKAGLFFLTYCTILAACLYANLRYRICNHTATKIPFMYFFSGNCAAPVPFSTYICL
jgi:hypothetical protein